MAEPPIDIDRVVREVLVELGLGPGAGGAAGTSAAASGPSEPAARPEHPPAAAGAEDGELVVTARVVTLSEVEGRLEAVRRLVVRPEAVVTPAVRDELLRRNVRLAFAASPAAPAAGQLRLILLAAGKGFDATTLVHALAKAGIEAELQESDCLIAATDRLAGEVVQPGTLGVLLTRHAAAALCLANRHRGVRAVWGIGAAAVSAAAASVGANLLVLDPAAEAFFQLNQCISEFCRGGARACPEIFRERLG